MAESKTPEEIMAGKLTLTIPEAAAVFGIPESTAYAAAKADRFPVRVLHFGPRVDRVSVADVRRCLGLDHGRTGAVRLRRRRENFSHTSHRK